MCCKKMEERRKLQRCLRELGRDIQAGCYKKAGDVRGCMRSEASHSIRNVLLRPYDISREVYAYNEVTGDVDFGLEQGL